MITKGTEMTTRCNETARIRDAVHDLDDALVALRKPLGAADGMPTLKQSNHVLILADRLNTAVTEVLDARTMREGEGPYANRRRELEAAIRETWADEMDAETAYHYGPGELHPDEMKRGTAAYEERLNLYIKQERDGLT